MHAPRAEGVLIPRLEEQLAATVILVQYRRIQRKEKGGMRLLKQKRPMSRTMVGLLFRRSIPGLRAGFFCCACTQTRVLALLRALRGPLLLAFAAIAAPADEAPESSITCLALRNLASSRECALASSIASLPRPVCG